MRRFLGRALVVAAAVALCGVCLPAVSRTAPHVARAAGWSGEPGWYIRGVCAPWREGARDDCPGRFTAAHGEPVCSYALQEDVRVRTVTPVRCEGGTCHATGVKPVAYWVAMTLFGLAALPVAAFLVVLLGAGNTWARLFVGLPVATGVVLAVAFLCLLVSGAAAENP
ncbi:hypothetical protein [Kitasatospora sp. NPDC058218]|uniref:hypothetical protein n=1 Tax=Kitasatospora sp. NPDC058218 TaxID=3346385 RepID=UPI0036DDB15E